MQIRKTSGSPRRGPEVLVHNQTTAHIRVVDFNEEATAKFTQELFAAECNPNIDHVFVWVSSYGGSVVELFAMIDLLDTCTKPVYTAAIGKAMSCGIFFLAAGIKGQRFVAPNTELMFHEASWGTIGKAANMASDTAQMQAMNNRLFKLFAKNTGKSVDFWKKLQKDNLNSDIYMTAADAVRYGIADAVGIPKLMTQVSEAIVVQHPEPRSIPSKRKPSPKRKG